MPMTPWSGPTLRRHGEATEVWGNSTYQGQTDVVRQYAPNAQGPIRRRYRDKRVVNEVERTHNRTKSQARSRVEHVFVVMKSIFHFTKVRAP